MRSVVLAVTAALALTACETTPSGQPGGGATATNGVSRETVQIASRTVSDFADILTGSGREIEIPATVYRPSAPIPSPAVVISHGSGGVHDQDHRYARRLAEMGFVVVVPDSFRPRGTRDTGGDQGLVSFASSVQDAASAVAYLRGQPGVDPTRIAVMGSSRGGMVAHMIADPRFTEAVAGQGAAVAATVALSPSCAWRIAEYRPTSTKVLFMVGAEDDFTPPRNCGAIVERLRAAGASVTWREFPGAYHSFDRVFPRQHAQGVQVAPDCLTEVQADGRGVLQGPGVPAGTAIGRDFAGYIDTIMRACGRRGATTGATTDVRADAQREVVEFLRSALSPRIAAGR